jgi:hypothetical protein
MTSLATISACGWWLMGAAVLGLALVIWGIVRR